VNRQPFRGARWNSLATLGVKLWAPEFVTKEPKPRTHIRVPPGQGHKDQIRNGGRISAFALSASFGY
jgi:hypothetical protein